MNIKYIGMDIHKETISIAVMNGEGKVVMEPGGLSFSTNSSMLCKSCVKRCGRICWPRVTNRARPNYCARFLRSARCEPHCSSR